MEIDLEKLLKSQENTKEECFRIKIPFFLDTSWLHKEFDLDVIIWKLSSENVEKTQKVVDYVLENFNSLFEAAWTSLYYYLCIVEPDTSIHTIEDFYQEQIDFHSPYDSIQLELNSEHLEDGVARYCFIVATMRGYDRWMISDDDMRIYMVNNRSVSANTNNDDTQIFDDYESVYEEWDLYSVVYDKMEHEGFHFAMPYHRFVQTP